MTEAILSVMVPVAINDTTLTSTTIPENDHALYDSGTTYALGDKVISTVTHRIYESGADNNLDKDPTLIENRVADANNVIWWIDVSATNAWKMFDGESSSKTKTSSPSTIVNSPGFISSLYVAGLVNVDTATINMNDSPGGTNVYSETLELENSFPPDYYEYCFSPFSQQPDFVLNDLPPYINSELTVTLSSTSGDLEVGMYQVGDLRPIGNTLLGGASVTPKTYSYIKIDDFGNNEIKRRKSARDMKLRAHVKKDYADTAIDILTQVLDVPSIWIASTKSEYSSLRVFGLGSGELDYQHPDDFFIRINIKGLI